MSERDWSGVGELQALLGPGAQFEGTLVFQGRIRIEGKFKLGQERSAVDKEGILRGLQSAKQPRGIRELTAAFYDRKA